MVLHGCDPTLHSNAEFVEFCERLEFCECDSVNPIGVSAQKHSRNVNMSSKPAVKSTNGGSFQKQHRAMHNNSYKFQSKKVLSATSEPRTQSCRLLCYAAASQAYESDLGHRK